MEQALWLAPEVLNDNKKFSQRVMQDQTKPIQHFSDDKSVS